MASWPDPRRGATSAQPSSGFCRGWAGRRTWETGILPAGRDGVGNMKRLGVRCQGSTHSRWVHGYRYLPVSPGTCTKSRLWTSPGRPAKRPAIAPGCRGWAEAVKALLHPPGLCCGRRRTSGWLHQITAVLDLGRSWDHQVGAIAGTRESGDGDRQLQTLFYLAQRAVAPGRIRGGELLMCLHGFIRSSHHRVVEAHPEPEELQLHAACQPAGHGQGKQIIQRVRPASYRAHGYVELRHDFTPRQSVFQD